MTTLLVVAKAPQPGRSKTRLCPPCTPHEAADIAEAALLDTLDAVAATPCDRHLLALDGTPGAWIPPAFDVVAQLQLNFDRRLAAAFDAADDVTLQIGMDTPQVTADLLTESVHVLERDGSVLGLAHDGGWWAIGLPRPDPEVFLGIAMSQPDTGAHQVARMRERGLNPTMLRMLRDVDTIDDAHAVAAEAPHTRFAACIRSLTAANA